MRNRTWLAAGWAIFLLGACSAGVSPSRKVPVVAIDEPSGTDHSDAMPLEAGEALGRACRAAVARDLRCGEHHIERDCSFYARAERIEAKPTYDCMAALPCGADAGTCRARLSPQTVGAEICGSLTRCTPSLDCDDDVITAINENLAWLNDGTIDLLRSCFEMPDCDRSERCITDFVAVYVPTTDDS
jgi:hypothetical protein